MWQPITPSEYNERRKGLIPVAGGPLLVNHQTEARFTEWGAAKNSQPLLRYEVIYYPNGPVYKYYQWTD